MKHTVRLRSFLALAGSSLLAMSSTNAANYYWDSNGTTAGLGDTAGTWGSSAFFHNITAGDARGVINGTLGTFVSVVGASGDTFYFGTVNLGLGAAASTIATTGTLTTTNLVIGAGQTNDITFSAGGTITLAGTTPTIAVNTTAATTTIAATLSGTVGMTKAGAGKLILTGTDDISGGINIRDGGTLQVGNGTFGSFTATNALSFNNGGGAFNLAQATGSSQGMGALTFTGGDGSIISTAASGAATQTLTFGFLAARAVGATGNFSLATNTTATDNKIVLGGASTGFLDKGLFFGGSSYAAYDATGYVRGLIYGSDTAAAATDTITASNHVQLTSSPAARTGDTLLSLNLSGGGVDYTMNAGSLTVPAILKSGGGTVSTISGGTSLTTASNAELVIRTDISSDLLTISSAVTGFSGGLTKTGAGTLTLSGSNGYTGATTINSGTLSVSGGSAIVDNQAVVIANTAGATLQLNTSETISDVTGGGFTGGNVNVQGNTLTLAKATGDYTYGGTFTGISAGGVIKQGSGKLTLSNKNTFAGTITLEGGALEFNYGNDGTGALIALSSGGAINMANGTTLRFNPAANATAGIIGSQLQAANGGSPAYPYGWTVANNINIASGTSTASIRVGGNENSVRFTGNVTGGTIGAQTLAIYQGGIAIGDGDRQPNVFSGTIANGSGGTLGVNIDFAGASTGAAAAYVSLSGQNTFTGPIVVTNSKGLTSPGGNVGIGGDITAGIGTGYLGGGTYTNTISLATGTKLSYHSSANQILGGQISGGGELIKRGSGTLTLSASNSYTGATTVNEGTLDLGGGTANGSLASTVLNMGGTTLNYTRTGGTTQAFTTTNITAGVNTITAVAGNTLTLGALARSGSGTVNFGTTGIITTSTANDATGIIGGWATIGGNWAVANGAGSAITGFAGTYTLTSSVLNAGASYNAVNIGVDSSQAPDAAITPNTLTFNTAGAYTLTLLAGSTNTIPGILVNSTVGDNASLITGGTALRGTSGGSLNIIQNNTTGASSALTIGSVIANNSTATALYKSGAGTLILTANNTYTGVTTINAGTLQLGNGGATGTISSSSIISGAGSVVLSGPTVTLNNSNNFSGGFTLNSGQVGSISGATYNGFGTGLLTINGGSLRGINTTAATIIPNDVLWNANVGFGRASGGNPIFTFNGNITLGASVAASTWSGAEPYSLTFNGNIGESSAGYGLSLSATSTGSVWTFNGQNTFTGNLNANSKSLVVGGSGYLGGGNYAGTITAAGGFTYSSSANQTLSGGISGTTLTKNTSTTSTLTLATTNSYSGATTVNAGTLTLGVSNCLANTSIVVIGAGILNLSNSVSDTVGTLDVTAGATINLGTGASLVFANSNGVDWTGGTLNITGNFTNTSIKFATSAGLSVGQLAVISVNGSGAGTYTLDPSGYLVPSSGTPYETWATGNEPFDGDANGDGVKDGLAFLLGAATPGTNATALLPTVTQSGGNLTLNFNCLPVSARGTATLKVAHSTNLASWTATTAVVPDATNAVPDNNVTFVVGAGPVGPPALKAVQAIIGSAAAGGGGKLFGRLEATE